MIANAPEERVGVTNLVDDVESVLQEETGNPFADERRVVGDHDPHGIPALRVVPQPAPLSTVSVASSASSRSRRPAKPESAAARAPPIPSSTTATRSVSSSRPSLTVAWEADACLKTLVSPSETRK
jgi:hypothetical protein